MEDEYEVFTNILELCLNLDQAACGIYHKFSELTNQDQFLTQFWNTVAEEERTHIEFWQKAIALCKEPRLPIVIGNLQETRNNLLQMKKNIDILIAEFNAWDIDAEKIMLAYTIESYLFDPTFMALPYLS